MREVGKFLLGACYAFAMLSLMLCVSVLMSGCHKVEAAATRPVGTARCTKVYDAVGAPLIFDCRLSDGTRCVTMRYDGGITCDWNSNKQEIEK